MSASIEFGVACIDPVVRESLARRKVARHAEIEFSVPGDRLLAPGVKTRGVSRGVRCELESGIVFWCFV